MTHKRAVIFVNGLLADAAAVKSYLRPDDWLIACDGGLNHLKSLGLQPELLIGDLDSVSQADIDRLTSAGVEIRRYPTKKNETDLELALLAAAAGGVQVIWLVAALGGRLDQTLSNLGLLLLPELSGIEVRLFDGREEVFLVHRETVIHGKAGEVVSLLPQQGAAGGVTTEGLEYPLHSETLYPERSRGISNRLLGETARVRVEHGLLLCIHTHQSSLLI